MPVVPEPARPRRQTLPACTPRTAGPFSPIVERTVRIIIDTLQNVPQLDVGEAQADPTSSLQPGILPNPAGRSRVVVHEMAAADLARFSREQNARFDTARDVLDFSGERILPVPESITRAAKPLPLTHVMPAEQMMREYGSNGLATTEQGIELQGLDYLMQLRPLHPTADGGTTGWNGQQPHFHQSPEEFHDQRLLHGVVPKGVTVVLFHPHGAEVAPGGHFVSIRIDARAGHQFCTIHDDLLALDPALAQRLRAPGSLDPHWMVLLHNFMDCHEVIPGVEFDSLTKADLAHASALLVSSHTKDPKPTGEAGENLMADQTMAILNPSPSFVPWTQPLPLSRTKVA